MCLKLNIQYCMKGTSVHIKNTSMCIKQRCNRKVPDFAMMALWAQMFLGLSRNRPQELAMH